MEIYRYKNKDGEKCEYRFEDGVCVGFFVDDEPQHTEKYKGRALTEQWKENLSVAGFNPIKGDYK